MNYKKLTAGILALSLTASLTACGGSTEGDTASTGDTTTADVTTTAATEWTGDDIEVDALDETLDVDISGKTLKWLGIYDLNPTNDSPERSPELALFEDTYGAKIEYMPTTSDKRFDDLATSILGGTSPDIFAYEWRTFPYDISRLSTPLLTGTTPSGLPLRTLLTALSGRASITSHLWDTASTIPRYLCTTRLPWLTMVLKILMSFTSTVSGTGTPLLI